MNKKRLLYLDNLKVCLTVLVIFHHAGQAYGDGGGLGRTFIYFIKQAGNWAYMVY